MTKKVKFHDLSEDSWIEHIRSKYGNFKEKHNASFKPQIVNKTLLYGNLHITTHNINLYI